MLVTDLDRKRMQDVFGKENSACRSVCGVAILPLDAPVELEIIFEVAG